VKHLIYLLLAAALSAQAQPTVKVTRDPRPNPHYMSYAEWLAEHPEAGTLSGGPTVIRPASSTLLHAKNGLVCVVVAQNLNTQLQPQLERYATDLENRDYAVEISTYSTAGSAKDLRNYLSDKLSEDLVGAVLVGELPVAWYQMNDGWNGNGQFDAGDDWYEEFPCDLFLSDLNGNWHDDSVYAGQGPLAEGSDGVYDSRTGRRDAEIWVSRIDASHITYKNQMTLYREYFDRVHAYREAELVLPSKGLFYIDQDWSGGFYNEKMDEVCTEYDEVRDTMITYAGDYENRIKEEGLYVTLCAHSSWTAHYFHKANSPSSDLLHNWELAAIGPQYGFYNLFACSNCRWVESNCMGSLYHFYGNGLASLGTTKTGSMLFFSEFNMPLSDGKTWGEAFKEWTNFWISTHGDKTWALSWFMGMCLLGDACINLKEQKPYVEAVAGRTETAPLVLSVDAVVGDEAFIRLTLPRTQKVHLAVFDASGRLAADLCNGVLSEGEHTLRWEASDAAAGVYFVRLTAEGGGMRRKITLVR